MKIKRPSQAIRIPIPTYDLICIHSALMGQQIFDFVGTLLEVWDVAGPSVRSNAIHRQAEKKKIEYSQLLKPNKRSPRK